MNNLNKKNIIKSLSILTATLLLTACGGGGSNSSGKFEDNLNNINNDVLVTGTFIDSPVEGMSYMCGDKISGITNSVGEFSFKRNCDLTFKVGEVTIGKIKGLNVDKDNKVTPSELLGLSRNSTNTPEVLKITRFLQSIDNDGNIGTSISIDEQTRNLLNAKTMDLTSVNTTISDINMTILGIGKSFVSEGSAISHYESSLINNLKVNVDNISPKIPTINLEKKVFNTESASIIFNGLEIGSKLYVNGNLQKTIVAETETIIFPLTGADGEKQFTVYLEDEHLNKSNEINFSLFKDKVVPSITSQTIVSVEENQKNLTQIIAEDTNTLSYSIKTSTNDDSNKFSIDEKTGVIKFIDYPDYETKSSYNFTISVSDGANITEQPILVQITDINEIIPIVENVDISVSESTTGEIGSAQVVIEGNSPIISYQIVNNIEDDSAYFSINNEGVMSTSMTFDYEIRNHYTFKYTATNTDGVSEMKTVNVYVSNVAESIPVLTNTILPVDNNTPAKTVIGSVTNQTLGDTVITNFILIGEHSNHFEISYSGEITVAPEIILNKDNVSLYNLTAVATNSAGNSNPVSVTINVQ